MEKSPELKKEVEELQLVFDTINNIKRQREINVSLRWDKISGSIHFMKFKQRVWQVARILSVAAFVPLLFAVYFLSDRVDFLASEAQEEMEVTSANGVVSKITLPDNSIVYLNSGSTLRYPKRFTHKKRIVSLSGEAYFHVDANKENRFDVMLSNGLVVSAYGTEFNINAYEEQDWVTTVLAKGNVMVSVNDMKNKKAVFTEVMLPGQMAVFDKNEKNIDIQKTNIYAATAWKDGKMVFRRSKMEDVIYRLSKHFNVDIELADKELLQYEYSATFTTETLSEILDLLKQSSPIQWKFVEPLKQRDYTYTKRKVIISMLL